MVLVEEVPESEIRPGQAEGEWTDDDASSVTSSLSNLDDDQDDEFDESNDLENETLYERFVALKDIVPPTTRSKLLSSYSGAKQWSWWGMRNAGTLAWVVTTSALLVGLPLALAIEDEARIVQQEREMQMQSAGQQQVGI